MNKEQFHGDMREDAHARYDRLVAVTHPFKCMTECTQESELEKLKIRIEKLELILAGVLMDRSIINGKW